MMNRSNRTIKEGMNKNFVLYYLDNKKEGLVHCFGDWLGVQCYNSFMNPKQSFLDKLTVQDLNRI